MDLQAFHSAHFAAPCIEHFSEHFLGPVEADEEEDDGLGYYSDGMKRTLTDEQIMMFRHSEIEALLRERRRAQESTDQASPQDDLEDIHQNDGDARNSAFLSEGELSQQQPAKQRRKKGKQTKKPQRRISKPDLRERTWDKVETGLETLDYEEENSASSAKTGSALQRRKISYDDSWLTKQLRGVRMLSIANWASLYCHCEIYIAPIQGLGPDKAY